MRETEVRIGTSGDEARELMFRARRDRAQMARRLNAEIARRDERERDRELPPLRYRIADLFHSYLRRIPFVPSFAKTVFRRSSEIRRNMRKKGSVFTDAEAHASGANAVLGFGVNMAGYLNSEKGVGEGGRATLRSLRAAEVPYRLIDFPDPGSSNVEKVDSEPPEERPYDFNLVHINPDLVPALAKHMHPTFWDHYNIGYWAWELSSVPRHWCDSFRYFEEIWVPSTFCLDAVSRVSPIPVVRIPHSIHVDVPQDPECTRSQFGIGPDTFVFLFFFDFHSIMQRKNPLGLIEAFRRAFMPEHDALLLIKCSRSDSDPSSRMRLEQASRGANVKMYDAVISRPALNSLMSMCDAYVSLHRSEGFGLTLTEAMSMGKPVIATAYSGNMDFMTPSNSFPVKYRLVDIEEDYGFYTKGCEWAEPDLDHAAELMRHVYAHRDEAAEVGKRAQQDVCSRLHPQTVGRMIRERLLKVNEEAGLLGNLSSNLAPTGRAEARRARAAADAWLPAGRS